MNNMHLRLYWRQLAIKSNFTGGTFWQRLLRTFQNAARLLGLTLKDAGIELLFLLAFWAIITKMGQGRDLIVSLFEPQGIYGLDRIGFTTLTVISFSISMWIIPAFLFQYRDNANLGTKRYRSIFREHLFFVHRVLPLIPFWLLAYVLFNGKHMWILFGALSLLQLYLLMLFHERVKLPARKWYAWAVTGLLLLAIVWFISIFKRQYNEAKIALVVIFYLIAFLANYIYFYVDTRILDEHVNGNATQKPYPRYWINSAVYTALLLIHIVAVIILFNANGSFELAPESILLYILSLYVFLIDLVVYVVNITRQLRFIATLILLIIVAAIYFSPRINFNLRHYSVDAIDSPSILKGHERLRLEDRYTMLKAAINADTSGNPYPIILVAGEGGGSRAGMWFSENLINYDYYTRGHFRNYIFSLSTVSGSSVGLSTLFAFWEQPMEGDSIHERWLRLPGEVYKNNFVGSSISGLLLTDLWKLTPFVSHSDRDRNSALQEEEAYHTERAVREVLAGKDLDNHMNIPKTEQDLLRDYMSFFYTKEHTLRTDRPLAFINTCRSNDGRRGIFSPVKLSDDYFNDAIDINGYLYDTSIIDHAGKRICDTNCNKTISLGQACNYSELFPLLSAPAYVYELGSFVDGGYHENTGLKTTLDIYQKLKEMLAKDPPAGKYMIYIVYLKNGSSEKDLYKPLKSELPLLLPLKALSAQPFEGSASYFEERARYIGGKDSLATYIQVTLNNHFMVDENKSTYAKNNVREKDLEEQILRDLRNNLDTGKKDSTLNFPLARWLSRSVIRRMRVCAFSEVRKDPVIIGLLNLVNRRDRVLPATRTRLKI
jgi:hypothetical protein